MTDHYSCKRCGFEWKDCKCGGKQKGKNACDNCWSYVVTGTNFCWNCGKQLRWPAVGGTLGTASKPPTEAVCASAEKASGANDKQVGGSHYQGAIVQHWDFVRMHKIPYMEAQIMKYVMRWPKKGGVQDLEKAKHFLEKLIEQNS